MIQKVRKRIGMMVILAFTAALLLACGGGSSTDDSSGPGGGDGPGPQPAETQQVVGSMSAGRIASTMLSKLSHDISPIRSDANPQSVELLGFIEAQEACTGSGTISISMDWAGPDVNDIDGCDQVSDLSVTLTLDACVQQESPNIQQSMALSVFKEGSLCQPENIYADVSDLHIIDNGDGELDFQSRSLQIDTTEITNSAGNGFMTHTKVALTGDVRGTRGEMQYAAQFDNYVEVLDTEDNHSFTSTVSGRIKSDCMEQWAEINTISPVIFMDQDCPTEGELEIVIGDESTTVVYHADGSVTVGDTTYDSCISLEGACNG
jgi:hypothetical protein